MKREPMDLTGQVFGYLTVIERVQSPRPKAGTCWRCKCACGNETTAYTFLLRSGGKVSCGCARRGNPAEKAKRREEYAVKAQEAIEAGKAEEEKVCTECQKCWQTGMPDPSRNGDILIVRVEDSYTKQPPYVDLVRYSIRDGIERYWSKTKQEHIPAFMVTGWMEAPRV